MMTEDQINALATLGDVRAAATAAGVTNLSGNRKQLTQRILEAQAAASNATDETVQEESAKPDVVVEQPTAAAAAPAGAVEAQVVAQPVEALAAEPKVDPEFTHKYVPRSGHSVTLGGIFFPHDGLFSKGPHQLYERFVGTFIERIEL